ncbi:MAG TPA: Maf family protein [Kofleriaceae bacterium]|nr:Maf family protein [Kofleriaceae bacterium]
MSAPEAVGAPRLVLASASPRRRELLERVGYVLDVRPADIDETEGPGEDPAAYVARVARGKADAVARPPGAWVLAADTTVTIDGAILGKAATDAEAAAMLRRLSGRVHQVMTAFTIDGGARRRDQVVTSDVLMVELDEATVQDYVASGDWRGKAGAYAIQGVAAALVREVRGSVTNVIGLPLAEVIAALRELGGPLPRLAAARAAP